MTYNLFPSVLHHRGKHLAMVAHGNAVLPLANADAAVATAHCCLRTCECECLDDTTGMLVILRMAAYPSIPLRVTSKTMSRAQRRRCRKPSRT